MHSKKTVAIRLRKLGKSYNEISRVLGGIPKSTLSGWLKDCRLSKSARQRLMNRNQFRWSESLVRYNKLRASIARQRSEAEISLARNRIGKITPRELLLIGTALYWAEGEKGARWRLKFSNSDGRMAGLMMRFFREICKIPENKFSPQLHLHPHVSESRAKTYWSQVMKIPQCQFIKSQRVLSRSSNGKRPSRRLPYGTLHIAVHHTSIRNRVIGWMAGLADLSNNSS